MAHVRQVGPHSYRVECKRTAADGVQHRWSWYAETKAEADEIAGEAERDLRLGVDPDLRHQVARAPHRGQTLRQWSVVWLAAQDLEESSRAKVRGYLDRDILPAFGDLVLTQGISRIAVKGWLTGLSTKKRRRTSRPLSPSSVSSTWSAMSRLCADAVAEGILERDPCQGLKAPKVPKRRDAHHVLAPAQLVALVAAMPAGSYRTLALLLAWTGCRWSEMAGLRRTPAEVQLMRRPAPAVVVTEPIKTTGKRGGRYHGEPKSEAGKRAVELIRPVACELGTFLSHGGVYAFPNSRGNPIHYEDFRKAFKRAAGRCGHPEWRVHDLRHTHATLLQHCARVAVQQHLGHEPRDVTDGYTHATDADRAEILRVVGGAWDEGHGGRAGVAAGGG